MDEHDLILLGANCPLAPTIIEFTKKPVRGGVAYLVQCPFDETHGGNGESAVIQADSGLLTYDCKHNSCQGRRWSDFREAVGAPDAEHWGGTSQSNWTPPESSDRQQTDQDKPPEPPRFKIKVVTCEELDGGDYSVEYFIPWILAKDQACLIAAPQNSSMTTLETLVDGHQVVCVCLFGPMVVNAFQGTIETLMAVCLPL